MEYIIEITQTVSTKRRIMAANDTEAVAKGNRMVANSRIRVEQCELVEAIVTAVACPETDNIIELSQYRQ